MINKQGFTALLFGFSLFAASGCDDGDDGSGDDESGDGDGDGDVDVDPSTGDDGGGDKGGDFGGDVGGGEGGELEGCALHETADDCVAEVGCTPVWGLALIDDGDGGWCTGAEEFIGCADAGSLCPAIGKTLCDADNYWHTSACVPDNVSACEAPGEITGAC